MSKVLMLVLMFVGAAPLYAAAETFTNFESPHVRPLAMSPDGKYLFAVNTPDDRLAVYSVVAGGLQLATEVPVGLEPVSVAVRLNSAGIYEAWVVNFLSDSVSVVDVDPKHLATAHVAHTLLVGDEPRDIVFAGTARNRAFITAAHRGQNRPGDPQLTTQGVGRSDVWVFDADYTGAELGGTPLSIVQMFGDTPRALAVSTDGGIVYAAVFNSGNQTASVTEKRVEYSKATPSGLPPAPQGSTADAPTTGLIVKLVDGKWIDEINRDWSDGVPFSLPDKDVFLINANGSPPTAFPSAVSGVGTVLFNMAVRPSNGKVYVSNTDALNNIRFQTALNGHFESTRISVINGTTATAHDLNPQINYSVPTGSAAEINQSIAMPTAMVFSSDGSSVYVAGFGSRLVGVLDANALESDRIVKSLIQVGDGPSGLALDASNDRLYVMNQIGHSISVVSHLSNPSQRVETDRILLPYDPTPAKIKRGQPFLYDARYTSGHGDVSCSSCHVFGELDGVAWDLGNPFGAVVPALNPKANVTGVPSIPYHPMKGPMTTQSLHGLDGAGPEHWRGDKTATVDANGNPTGGSYTDTIAAFELFNPAFTDLQGRSSQLTAAQMEVFAKFAMTIHYPPNPIHALDNSDSSDEAAGRDLFNNHNIFGAEAGGLVLGQTCQSCHAFPVTTTGQTAQAGLVPNPQLFKIPHLRNLYQKVGMFGVAAHSVTTTALGLTYQPPSIVGDQIRGFGFNHDGSVSTIETWLHNGTFTGGLSTVPPKAELQRRQLEAFLLGADTGMRPMVGQQVTVTAASVSNSAVSNRLNLILARADTGDCDVVVKGIVDGIPRGMLYSGSGTFISDRYADGALNTKALLSYATTPGQELTFTCVPSGNGTRIGIDRDQDGVRDRDELDHASNPADATVVPSGLVVTTIPTSALKISGAQLQFTASTQTQTPGHHVVLPTAGGISDPTRNGATLMVYNAADSGESVAVNLPASGWKLVTSNGVSSYSYSGGAIQAIKLAADSLQIQGQVSAYTLDEPQQGYMALRLQLGQQRGTIYCAAAGAQVSGSPLSTAGYDRPGLFTAEPGAAYPTVCPEVPLSD